MNRLRMIESLGASNKKFLRDQYGYANIKNAYSDLGVNNADAAYELLKDTWNIFVEQERENKKKAKKEAAKKAQEDKYVLYKEDFVIDNNNIGDVDYKIANIQLEKMKKKVKAKDALYQIRIEYFDNNGNNINRSLKRQMWLGDQDEDGNNIWTLVAINFRNVLLESKNIDRDFESKVNFHLNLGSAEWLPFILLDEFYSGGYTKITTRALKPVQAGNKRPQIYKDNDTGTCVYDGVVKYFESSMEKNKNAKAIYNKLINNKDELAKPYTDEMIEKELAPFCNSSITIKNLINGKDKKLNENTFNRFNIEFLNTKHNHLDLLAHNYNEVEEVSKEKMIELKNSLSFYINKCGSLITIDKTYKQIDTEFQKQYKFWKQLNKDLYNVDYDKLFIYKDTNEYEMLNRYDYKLHTFFNEFEVDNSLYKEADLKKAYFNYSNKEFNRFYRGVPSGSFLNFSCNENFNFRTITDNGLIGFYEIKIINSSLDSRLGFTNNSIHYLFTSMIELLLENNVEFKFLNASYSPSVHIPFMKQMLESENGLKHYCKAFGLMLAENSIIDITIKPLKCDDDYFDTICDENLHMFKDNNLVKLQYVNKKPKSYIHIGYAIHAYTQTLILEQLIQMNLDFVFGVKLDSIVYKKDYEFSFNNNFDNKKCKVEGLLKKYSRSDEEEYFEEDEFDTSGFYRKYIMSRYTKNLNFRLPFTQSGEYITNRVVFIGGAGGTGKTYSLLNYLDLPTACYSTMCWNLIQGKMTEYKGLNGHSIPQLTGGTDNFKCERTTDKNIRHIILDEATLLSSLDIVHIINDYPACFIYILGDVDFDGTFYQCRVNNKVFNPSVDTHFEEEVYCKCKEQLTTITYDFTLQYIKYTKTFRFDENLNNKLSIIRDVMSEAVVLNKFDRLKCIMKSVKKVFAENFKNIEDIIYNDNDVGISAKDDLKAGNDLTNYFIEKGSKPKYFIKKTIKEKNQLKGQELFELPSHNNYELKLFKTIHSFQGLDLSHDNKIIIIIDSLFDENLLYTALSRARRQDQIILIDKTVKQKEEKEEKEECCKANCIFCGSLAVLIQGRYCSSCW